MDARVIKPAHDDGVPSCGVSRAQRGMNDALQNRDHSKLRVRADPGSAQQHCVLQCARDTRLFADEVEILVAGH
jgi:hypothetical protein